ncbi:MAG: hypothetical protein IPL51_09965 [Candidatus Competibacteraceae bacterium]|nr:hypothetical protein [Candidatus Competibacteraceae bacterium]
MVSLTISDDAKSDLKELLKTDGAAAGRIIALLQEIQSDADLMDRLTQHDFGACQTAEFHISKWNEQWRKGNDLWRLKIWDLEDQKLRYRIVYAFIPRRQKHVVLGVAPRSFNYDPRHELSIRILRAYQNLL